MKCPKIAFQHQTPQLPESGFITGHAEGSAVAGNLDGGAKYLFESVSGGSSFLGTASGIAAHPLLELGFLGRLFKANLIFSSGLSPSALYRLHVRLRGILIFLGHWPPFLSWQCCRTT